MAIRNAVRKSGRVRGHEGPPSTLVGQYVVEEMHEARKGRQQGGVRATAAAMKRMRQSAVKFKAPQSGGEGRTTRLASPGTLQQNRSNVHRKPSARRTSPFKQMMRRQTISRELAQIMREQPEKGDRRRSEAQRKLIRRTREQVSDGNARAVKAGQ